MKDKNEELILDDEKQEKKIKKNKIKKTFFKTITVILCFTFLGLGIGAGNSIAKNLVAKQERANFSFGTTTDDYNVTEVSLSSSDISSVFEEVGESVVNISTIIVTQNVFTGTSSGSGIIYKIDGDKVYIITNNHVIEDAKAITVSVTGTEQVSASLVGSDASSDIAVLSVSKTALQEAGIENVTVAKFSDSDNVKVGEFVFAIGNALGMGKTITQGIISAQNKEINIDGVSLTVLQTDAAINPGNSGGALINSQGEVVGVNTAKLSSSAIEGIGYAIPINTAVSVANNIIENGSVQKPYLGIQGQTVTEDIKRIFNLKTDGVLVIDVEEGGAAYKAGIIATDIITSFNGTPISSLEDLSNAIKDAAVNEVVEVTVIRNGFQEMNIEVTLYSSSS